MDNSSSLNHSRWECKYHVVWIPKYRRKTLYGQVRKYLGEVFRDLARGKESIRRVGPSYAIEILLFIRYKGRFSGSIISFWPSNCAL
jgi:putative transposase